VQNSNYNRRLTGTTKIKFSGGIKVQGSRYAIGTFANCAGGVTPWNTVLTCEENYQDFYGDRNSRGKRISKGQYHWENFYKRPPEHYGWVVEVDPVTGEAQKHVSMGRFSHESATCIKGKDGRTVVYSGDDKAGEFLYKFIADKPGSLVKGELFVANTEKGQWISLDRNKQPKLKKRFKTQLDVLIYCREAARLLGGHSSQSARRH
jgi:secreted PhoX family phosphatase